MRTIVFGLLLTLLAPDRPVFAEGADPLHRFATCTGRLSALVEHQWLLQDPASDRTASRRDEMASLYDATVTPDRAALAMSWRIEAKVAEAGLLSEASFGSDPARARAAGARAGLLVRECLTLLLSEARA